MNEKLSQQIEAVLDALTLSQTRATLVSKTMRKLGVNFGLNYSHPEDDIAQLMGRLRYMKLLAERREAAGE